MHIIVSYLRASSLPVHVGLSTKNTCGRRNGRFAEELSPHDNSQRSIAEARTRDRRTGGTTNRAVRAQVMPEATVGVALMLSGFEGNRDRFDLYWDQANGR